MLSFNPKPDPDQARMQPWWRRLGQWLGDFHKFATTLVVIAGATIGVHVWLKGLITRVELDVAVAAAVEKALAKTMADVKSDLETVKSNTGGLPAWRADVTIRLTTVEVNAHATAEQTRSVNERVDRYLMARAGR